MMQLIKQFAVGDRVPDDAKLLTTAQYVNFKEQERIVDFYFLVPDNRKKRSKRPRA